MTVEDFTITTRKANSAIPLVETRNGPEERQWRQDMEEKSLAWNFYEHVPNVDLTFFGKPAKQALKNLGLKKVFGKTRYVGEGVEVEYNAGFKVETGIPRVSGYHNEKYFHITPSAYVRATSAEGVERVVAALSNRPYITEL